MSCCSACGAHACACGCGTPARTPLAVYNRPGLDAIAWRVGTYGDFHATMQADLSSTAYPALAGLRTREADDPAMALIDAWSAGADVLTFYGERIANEGYLRTATERRSVLELARLVDYRPRPGVAASVYLAFTVDDNAGDVTIAAGSPAQSVPGPGEQMQTFETAEALDARPAWNALMPRMTQPQQVSRDNLDTLDSMYFAGDANDLKQGQWLVFDFDDGQMPGVRKIASVTVDNAGKRTIVGFEAVAGAAIMSVKAAERGESPLESLVESLTRPPTLQPANALRLSRSIQGALGKASDARPQLLQLFQPRLVGTLYSAWGGLASPRGSAQVQRIYVQRVSAPRFGYNAAVPMKIVTASDGTVRTLPTGVDWSLDTPTENADTVFLDNAYEGIQPGTYVVQTGPGTEQPVVRRITAVSVHPRTAYGIPGKTTEITLEPLESPAVARPRILAAAPTIASSIRVQQLAVKGELLTLADVPISANVGDTDGGESPANATRLVLDQVVDGLEGGRWLIVQGVRSDLPGNAQVVSSELVMVEAVEQGIDPALPGDSLHSTLVLANDGLAYSYRRDTVKVLANVVRATHGQTRNEVLGNGDGAQAMQAFVLKQSPLTFTSASNPDGVASSLLVRVDGLEWHEVRNMAFAAAKDRSFVTRTGDDGKTTVTFGDGVHGRRLSTGAANVVARYRNGIGSPGNVAAGQVSLLASRPLGVKDVINPLPASGGADPETRDQARVNVPLAVMALDRLVSIPDYANFSRTFGGVGKAAAVALAGGVRVTIAGAGDIRIDTTSDVYRNLLSSLQIYGDPSLPVALDVRELLALSLSAKVGLAADYAWELVEPVIRAALLDAFGFERSALARNVYLSQVIACIQGVQGVAWVDVDAFDTLDESTVLASLADGDGGDLPDVPGVVQRVLVQPARLDAQGQPLPAQLAYFLPNVPDTLLLQEATP